MEAFADASTFGLDDYQYLSEVPVGEYRAPTRQWRKRRKGSVRQFVMMAAGIAALTVAVFSFYLYVNYKRLGGNLGTLAERQAAQAQGEGRKAETASDGSLKPALVPVASTPGPAEVVPPAVQSPAPEIVPTNDDNRAAAAALAVSGHNNSPAALLTQLTMPAVKSPGVGNTSLASPAPGNDASLLVHVPDKNVDPFRAAVPKPQKVSNNALE